MAYLQKTLVHGNERLDKTDYDNIENFVAADFDEIFDKFFHNESVIVKGFEVYQDEALTNPAPSISPVYVKIADSTLLHTNQTTGPKFYVGPSTEDPVLVNLTNNATNYIEVDTSTETSAPAVRAFWDQSGASGQGVEFSQTVDTVTLLKADITVNTVAFSGGTKIPIAEIEMDGSGNILALYDRRNRFYRLGRGTPYDDDYAHPWPTGRNESVHTLTISSVSGPFTVGEVITGGSSGTTAKIVTGGSGPAITITAKNQESFTIGEIITGDESTETAQVDVVKEDFFSADKNILTLKDWLDAMMTEMKNIKFGAAAQNRYWFESPDFSLGNIFLDLGMSVITGGGTVSWDGANFAWTGDIILNVITQSGNYSIPVAQSPIALADEDVAYIDLSEGGGRASPGARTLVKNTKANVDFSNDHYWIAYRKGSKLMIRGMQHELETGEEATIDEGLGNDLFTYIGSSGETDSDPNYSSTNYITQGSSLTTAIGVLDGQAQTNATSITNHSNLTSAHGSNGNVVGQNTLNSHTGATTAHGSSGAVVGQNTLNTHMSDTTTHGSNGAIVGFNDLSSYLTSFSSPTITGTWNFSTPPLFPSAPSTPTANRSYREGLAKAAVYYRDNLGIYFDYNIASVTDDDGDGTYIVNWDRNFSSSSYATAGLMSIVDGGDADTVLYISAQISSSITIGLNDISSGGADHTFTLVAHGNQ